MSARKALVLAIVWCAAGAGFGKSAASDTTRVFGVWTATCWTAEARCAAETDAIVRTPYRVTLSVARANGADAPWQAGLRLRKVRLGAAAGFTLDTGDKAMTFKAGDYEAIHGGGTIRLADRDDAAAMIRALMVGGRATVAFAAQRRGEVSRDFLINGLAEALSWINRRQGRGTSVSAQIAPAAAAETARPPAHPAARAESAEPPRERNREKDAEEDKTVAAANEADKDKAGKGKAEPDVPLAVAVPDKAAPEKAVREKAAREDAGAAAPDTVPTALITQHQRKSECEDFGTGTLKGLKARGAPLSRGRTLYLVPCFAADEAVASRLYVAHGTDIGTVRTLFFANFSHTLGWYGSDTLINAAYDAESKVLTAGGTGGGKGCGNAARYRWDGFDFRLMEYRASDDCDGPADPAAWPVVYAAQPGKT